MRPHPDDPPSEVCHRSVVKRRLPKTSDRGARRGGRRRRIGVPRPNRRCAPTAHPLASRGSYVSLRSRPAREARRRVRTPRRASSLGSMGVHPSWELPKEASLPAVSRRCFADDGVEMAGPAASSSTTVWTSEWRCAPPQTHSRASPSCECPSAADLSVALAGRRSPEDPLSHPTRRTFLRR
jgi:hypothetical protein